MARRSKRSKRGRSKKKSGRGRSGSRGGGDRGRFEYKRRSKETVKKRAKRQGGDNDFFLLDQFETWTPDEGRNRIRILPPTWEEPEHYGWDVFVHYGIGSDNGAFACLQKHDIAPCPICEERAVAEQDGDTEYASELKPSNRVLCWIIDRDNEDAGPLLYSMPWTLDRDIASRSMDDMSGEILYVDAPYEGYDIQFERKGTGINTDYVGVRLARHESPLHEDDRLMEEWLDFVDTNPVPDTINFEEPDYVERVFTGMSSSRQEEEYVEEDEEYYEDDEFPEDDEYVEDEEPYYDDEEFPEDEEPEEYGPREESREEMEDAFRRRERDEEEEEEEPEDREPPKRRKPKRRKKKDSGSSKKRRKPKRRKKKSSKRKRRKPRRRD